MVTYLYLPAYVVFYIIIYIYKSDSVCNIWTRLNENARIYRLNLFHVNVKRKNKYIYNISLSTSLTDNLQSVRANADCARIMHVIVYLQYNNNNMYVPWRNDTCYTRRRQRCRNINAVGARVVAEPGVCLAYIIIKIYIIMCIML